MAETSGTRRARRAQARAERRERERIEAARAKQRRRLFQLGGAVALAAAIIVVIVLATGSGDSGPVKRAGEPVAGASDTAALLDGIPQRGAMLGDPRAPVTVVEFGDLQCPYCKLAAEEIVNPLIEEYVRDGSVRIIFRDVAFLGTDSVRGAQMAAAAGLQDKLWNFVGLFYANQGDENSGYVTDAFLEELGSGIDGFDVARAMDDRGTRAVQSALDEGRDEWQSYGLSGTPAFVVGRTGGELNVVDDPEGVSFEALQDAIDPLLAER